MDSPGKVLDGYTSDPLVWRSALSLTILRVAAGALQAPLAVPLQRVDVTAEAGAVIRLAGRVRVDGLVDACRGASRYVILQLNRTNGSDGRERGKNESSHRGLMVLVKRNRKDVW